MKSSLERMVEKTVQGNTPLRDVLQSLGRHYLRKGSGGPGPHGKCGLNPDLDDALMCWYVERHWDRLIKASERDFKLSRKMTEIRKETGKKR